MATTTKSKTPKSTTMQPIDDRLTSTLFHLQRQPTVLVIGERVSRKSEFFKGERERERERERENKISEEKN